ncbi:MAG: VTT domain-containing protein, partial [Chloroflexota bacterium]|nr:VTT domain-containing protein [Chloroflexota bacterium]
MRDEQHGDDLAWTRAALLTGLIIAIGGAVWVWREPLFAFFSDAERAREWVAGFGPWGPLVSVALNVAQVLLAPLPGQFVGLLNGYLYGLWLGVLYSMAGLLLGTALAMGLARRFGRPLVERLAGEETLARWDRLADRRGPLFFFLVFLFPFVPDD